MGHLTLRELRHWDRFDTTGNETYTNNRRLGWQYDADGRLLSGNSQYAYDAAGQISSFGDGDPYMTDQLLDGDGRRVKSVQRRYDLSTNQWTTEKITYYIHSSVLGQLISEVSAQGAKERSFVYAGSEVMAIQSTAGGQFVQWQHYDAGRGSHRSTDPQGGVGELAEMDPMGADAGWMKPLTWPQPNSPGKLEPYYGVPDLNSATQGCILDDVPVPCDMLTNDNSVPCEDNHCGPVLLEKVDKTGKVIGQELSKPFQAWADGGFGHLPRDAVYTGNGRYSVPQFGELGDGRVQTHHASSLPQKPSPSATPAPAPTCGVNPVTGTPGFTRNPMGQTGHLRAPIGGQGQFRAPRPRNRSRVHAGLDIAGVLNTTPVVGFLPGTITFAGHTPGDGGTLVIIDHGGGLTSGYVHLQRGSIPAGVAAQQPVSQGQQIGTLGNSGNAGGTPPHLHFWIKLNGVLQDPEIFLNQPCPP